jgi:hypothetical protein
MLLVRLFTFLLFFFHIPVVPEQKASALFVPEKPVAHNTGEGDEMLPWLISRKLTWDDFLSEPQHDLDAVALTSTSLGISYRVFDNKLTYGISCHFSKTKSWGVLRTPYILAHEQGHFDITEIFARKLHKALQHYKLNKKTFQKDINTIYKSIVKEKEVFQDTYDSETNHSRNKKAQQKWSEKIERMLAETEPYSDYP